jgi:P pilus assembly chaperone PapD
VSLPRRAALTAATTAIALLANAAAGSATVVISEFKTGGTGGVSDEFIELLNRGPDTVNVGGSEVTRKDTAGSVQCTVVRLPNTVNLEPGQHYLATGTAYSGGTAKGK